MSLTQDSPLADWLAWLEKCHPVEIDLGLERIRDVYHALALPATDAKVITVAGTNGKGSSLAMLEAILLAAGYRVGAYTSPHLIAYNERIRISGQTVTDAEITHAFAEIDKARGDISLTYFEFGTLAALCCFQQAHLDVILLEVGLGGRLDAVNIIDADVALLTTVGLDHQQWLGETLDDIGFEKAGIMRAQRPVIIAERSTPESVLQYARESQSSVHQLGRQYDYLVADDSWSWRRCDGSAEFAHLPLPRLSGRQQCQNAAAVIEALQCLPDLTVSEATIKKGLQNVQLAGRCQVLRDEPLWLVDVCHNVQAVEAFASVLDDMPVTGRTHALFAMLDDKAIAAAVAAIAAQIDAWWIFDLQVARAASVDALENAILQVSPHAEVRRFGTIAAAITALQSQLHENDRVTGFGSFYTVAQIMQQGI
jgi:dihydrofolate synthase/folylpolyglutamate synthase